MIKSKKSSDFVKWGKHRSLLCSFYRGQLPGRLKYVLRLALFHCEILDIFHLLFLIWYFFICFHLLASVFSSLKSYKRKLGKKDSANMLNTGHPLNVFFTFKVRYVSKGNDTFKHKSSNRNFDTSSYFSINF